MLNSAREGVITGKEKARAAIEEVQTSLRNDIL